MITKLQTHSNPRSPVTPAVRSLVLPTLANLFSPAEVREQAWRLGVIRRQGKVDAYELLVVVVLSLVLRGPTAIAQLGHLFTQASGVSIARSSFWSRFNRPFSELVKWALDRLVAESRGEPLRPPGVLSGFRDVLAADATVMKVHDSLRPVWKGTRRNSAKAAVKVHAWVRVLNGELVKYRVTREAHADSKAFGIDSQLRGVLMLFDMGYASPSLWRRIDSVGGFFLTRIPAGWNPVVISENRRHRGRARTLSGLKLRDALRGLRRKVVDVQAEFNCRVRGYAGLATRKEVTPFRVIALMHPTTGEYSLYATNAPERLLPAHRARDIYRLRWEVETFFKTVKSGSAANEFPSRNRYTVEALLYAGLLRAALAMRAKARQTWVFIHRVNHGQWIRWWNRQLEEATSHLLGREPDVSVEAILALLADPNGGRIPTRFAFSRAEL